MDQSVKCSLCEANTQIYTEFRNKKYYLCPTCDSIQMDPKYFLSIEDEKARYQTHNNDVDDPRYQQFVYPIVNAVLYQFDTTKKGLDFGAGTGPVISKMLKDNGYEVAIYDPFFKANTPLLQDTYDFIVVCEVVEHFHFPKKEFKLLKSLLKEGGSLLIMTELVDDKIDFKNWYYKNDPTHVFFYHKNTFLWIKENFGFQHLTITNRFIQLS